MHLPDHFLDPATMAMSGVISGGAVAYSLHRVRMQPTSKTMPAAGVAAAIFAAQMVNFPVAAGTSGHLVGGALAGMLLGPWVGVLAMTAVLAVQAVLFGDGGILALGANVLNMGLIGVAIGVAVDRLLVAPRATASRGPVRRATAAALAGWLSVVAAALACAIEIAVAGAASAADVVPAMLAIHAVLGLAEGAITAALVTALAYLHRPASMAGELQAAAPDRPISAVAMLLFAAIVLALAPFASPLPDGLESVAHGLSFAELRGVATVGSILTDYAVPGVTGPHLATVLAGALGVALVYGVMAFVRFGHRRATVT